MIKLLHYSSLSYFSHFPITHFSCDTGDPRVKRRKEERAKRRNARVRRRNPKEAKRRRRRRRNTARRRGPTVERGTHGIPPPLPWQPLYPRPRSRNPLYRPPRQVPRPRSSQRLRQRPPRRPRPPSLRRPRPPSLPRRTTQDSQKECPVSSPMRKLSSHLSEG